MKENIIYIHCTTDEALKLVKRKKYNKIILISNAGKNNQGADFIQKAKQIIGNNVIALFSAKMLNHTYWIENFGNDLFSNELEFTKEYLQIYNYDCYEYERINMIQNFIKKLENHYNLQIEKNLILEAQQGFFIQKFLKSPKKM